MTRMDKVRSIIRDNLATKGLPGCVSLLNKGGFPAPCGRKRQWRIYQIIPVMNGFLTVQDPPRYDVGAKLDEETFKAIDAQPGTKADFLRAAVREKLIREGVI